MNDIVIGVRLVGDSKGLVGEVRLSRQELQGLSRETQNGAKAANAGRQAAEDYARALKKQYDTVSMTTTEIKKYEVANLQATDAEKRAMAATIDATEAMRRKLDVAEKIGRTLGGLINTALQAGAAMAAVVTKESIQAAIQAEQSQLRLQAVLKATGHAAGLTEADIEGMVQRLTELTQFDDEALRKGAGTLLMFGNVGKESFEEVLKIAASLAAFMGTDLNAAVMMVGKAMQDPVGGLTALQRATGAFSDSQREAIKEMVESGRQTEAMTRLLELLKAKGIDGVAEAMNSGLSKAYEDNKKQLDELMESIGNTEAVGGTAKRYFEGLTQVMKDLGTAIDGTSGKFSRFFSSEEFLGTAVYRSLRALGAIDDPYQANAAERPPAPRQASHAEQIAAQDGRIMKWQQDRIDLQKKLGEEAEKAAKKEAAAYAKVEAAAAGYIESLQKQLLSQDATLEQKIMIEAATKAMTLATEEERVAYLDRAKVVAHALQLGADELELKRELARIDKEYAATAMRHAQALGAELEAQRDRLAQLEEEARLVGLSAKEVEQLTLRRMEERLEMIRGVEGAELEIAVLEKRIDLQRRIVEQTGENEGLRRQADLWGEVSDRVGDVGTRMVMAAAQGKSAIRILTDELKDLLAQLVAITLKRWVLQIAAGVTGNAALSIAAGQVGQGTVAGSLMNYAGTAMSGYQLYAGAGGLSGALGTGAEFYSGLQGASVYAPGTAGYNGMMVNSYANAGGGTGMSAAGIAGIVAIVVAAMIANDRFFGEGWRADNQSGIADMPGGPLTGDRLLRGLGFNDRWASLISGSSLHTRLWGRRQTQADAYGMRGTVGPDGVTGESWQDFSQAGGTFRSDRRWQESRPFGQDETRLFAAMMSGVTTTIENLGRRLGIDPTAALAGYSSAFDVQLSEDGKPLSDEELNKRFNEIFVKVLRDQTALLLDAAGNSGLAQYVRELTGSTEEIAAGVQAVLGLVDAMATLDETIAALEGGPLVALNQQLEAMNARVTDAQAALDTVIGSGDPGKVLAAEQQLMAAVMDRYNAEISMVRQLQQAIDALQQQAYEFALGMAQRINSVGGSRDIGAIAFGRATDLRGTIGGTSNPGRQLQNLQQYVGAIDTWYQSRRSAIERDIQTQAAAAQAAQAAQEAVYQARISAIETELQLTQQWAGVLERAGQMIDGMRLSSTNPLHALGRLGLARGDAAEAREAYLAATGGDRATAANRYLDALQRELELLGQSYQRPSPEYQAIYNEIISQLSEVEGEARTGAERAIELQQQLNMLQGEANAIASATFDVSAAMNAAMAGLNQEALSYYTWAEEEGRRLYDLQIQQHQEQLTAITGGMDVELFIAMRQSQAVELLREIRDSVRSFMTNVTTPPPPPAPGDGSPAPGSSGLGRGDVNLNVVLRNTRGEILETVKISAPELKRLMGVS